MRHSNKERDNVTESRPGSNTEQRLFNYSINAPIGVILKTAYNYYALADFEPYI